METNIGRNCSKIITGVGINLSQPSNITSDYPQTYYQSNLQKKTQRDTLITEIANNLYSKWNNFIQKQQINLSLFTEFDMLHNKKITIQNYNRNTSITTVAKGISENGFLLIEIDSNLVELDRNHKIKIAWEK